MKQLFVAVCSLLSALLWGGCSVRELPEGGGITLQPYIPKLSCYPVLI